MGILSRLFNKKTSTNHSKEPNLFQTSGKSTLTNVNANAEIEPIYKKKLNKSYFPGEIILLWWVNGKKTDYTIPGYFEYRYGIDASKSIHTFLKKGLIRYSSPFESLQSMKVDQLKEILKFSGLEIKGKKSNLIERITEHLNEQELSKFIKFKTYSLSQEGQSLTKEYDYVIYGHTSGTKDTTVTPASMIEAKNQLPSHLTNKDIAWHLLEKAALTYAKERYYGSLGSTYFLQAQFLQREEKYIDSLVYWILSLTLDLSGLGNSTNFVNHPEHYNVIVIPHNFEEINKILENGNLGESDFDDAYNRAWKIYTTATVVKGFLNKSNNLRAIYLGMNGDKSEIQQFYKKKIRIV